MPLDEENFPEMKNNLIVFILLLLVSLVGFTSATGFSVQDYEIFRLNDKIVKEFGKGTSFYNVLELPKGSKSTIEEINKAYRRLSRRVHPDKFSRKPRSERKKAEETFQRLSVIGNILRDKRLKKRYDFFYAKGFPKWKKTGYYYTKYRPGLLLAFFFVFIIIGIFHYVVLTISRKQDFKRVLSFKQEIKKQAWGNSMIPPSDGSDRRITSNLNFKQFLVTAAGGVFLIEKTGDNETALELDEYDINSTPSLKESYFYRLPCYIWNVTLGKAFSKQVDTTVSYKNPNKVDPPKKKKKAKNTGKNKIELPNGKIVYGRNTLKK